MKIPKKALRESDITRLTAGNVIEGSANKAYKVSFKLENGQEVTAFLKKISENYPPLLAKISVATSVFKRMFQGDRSAEERLVFDDNTKNPQLIGTVSICLKQFNSFNFYEDEIPLDNLAKEQAIPSTKTLVEKNMMELLFGRWFLYDDDAHPHNQGLEGDIDFDMFFYWFTIWMKNPRMFVGVPNKTINLTVADWETFPNIKDSKPFHWPTYKTPGQETLTTGLVPEFVIEPIRANTLPKRYPAPEQFIALASDSAAQDQKFAVALKALLTFQPDMIEKRLYDYFGELTLDYTSLNKALCDKYEADYNDFCNPQTDKLSFISFMMKMYQTHYDNLYRVVVFYMGCDNNKYGMAIKPTYQTLYCKPSFYKAVATWSEEQNSTLYSKEEKALYYDLDKLEKRYHRVWRDSLAPVLKQLWLASFHLTNQVLGLATRNKTIGPVIADKDPTDGSVTTALQLFGNMPIFPKTTIEPLVCVDKDSNIRPALFKLIEFTNQFREAILAYYETELINLKTEDNANFSKALSELYSNYFIDIQMLLAQTSTPAVEFSRISAQLKQLMDQVHFSLHLASSDEHVKEISISSIIQEQLPLKDSRLIEKFNMCLFNWAKNLEVKTFNRYIKEIVEGHYAPYLSFLSTRNRASAVMSYLDGSMHQAGDNRLAYIFSSGSHENGELNTLLIKHLTPLMLENNQQLPSIKSAVQDGKFKTYLALYTTSAVKFAKSNYSFMPYDSSTGICLYDSPTGSRLFFKAMYEWLEKLDSNEFVNIVRTALVTYETNLSRFSTSRRVDVLKCVQQNKGEQAKMIASIFNEGDYSSTLNEQLFHQIVITMQASNKVDSKLLDDPGYKLIMQYARKKHIEFYKIALKEDETMLNLVGRQANKVLSITMK